MPEEQEVQGKPENVSFDSEGYKMTPDDKMRQELEAEIMGTTIEVEAETQETEKEQPKAEENHEGANNSKEETIMENQYEQQNAVQPEEEKSLFSGTIDYVSNNPLTVAAGVAVIAGATLLISKKLSKPSVDTLSLAPASSMASAVAKSGSKAAKYALMMRR